MDSSFVWLWLLLLGAVHGINPGMGWLFAVARGLQERSGPAVWQTLVPLALGHALAIGTVAALAALVGLAIPLGYLKWGVAASLIAFGGHRLLSNRHPRWARWGGMRVGARDLTIWSFLMASAHGAGVMVLPFMLHGGPATEGGAPATGAVFGHSHAIGHRQPRSAGTPDGGSRAADATVGHGHVIGHSQPRPTTAANVAGGSGDGGAVRSPDSVDAGPVRPDRIARFSSDRWFGLTATLIHTAGYLLVTGLAAFAVYRWFGLRLLRAAWINLDLVWAAALIATGLLTPLI